MEMVNADQPLEDLEKIIKDSLGAFYRVGAALIAIKEGGLYKQSKGGKYKTFEAYCKGEWDMSSRNAERLMLSSSTVDNLRPIGRIPQNESQARPLTKLEPDQQRKAWEQAVKTKPEEKITAKHVESIVKEIIKPKQPSPPDKEKKKATQETPAETIFTDSFVEAFNNFYAEVQSAKLEKWKATTKEAALYHTDLINDLITIS